MPKTVHLWHPMTGGEFHARIETVAHWLTRGWEHKPTDDAPTNRDEANPAFLNVAGAADRAAASTKEALLDLSDPEVPDTTPTQGD